MAGKILIRRGNFADLPDLDQGELGYVEDRGTVYIGTNTDYNILLNPVQVNPDGYSLDGYFYPAIDNVHGLGTPDNRWKNLNVGPGSIHIFSRTTDLGFSANHDYKIGIDPSTGKLQISGDGIVLLEGDPDNGIQINGAASEIDFQSFKDFQNVTNHSIVQSLDGYQTQLNATVSETTFQQHANQQNQVNQTILQSLDGYQVQLNGTVSEITFQEHSNQQNQINQTVLQSLDGYQIEINGLVSEITFQEHANQQNQINQTILHSLDGYATTTLATDSTSGLMSGTDKQNLDWLGITSYSSNVLTFNPIAPADTYFFNNTVVRAFEFNLNNNAIMSSFATNQFAVSALAGGNKYVAFDVSTDLNLKVLDVNGNPIATRLGTVTSNEFAGVDSGGNLLATVQPYPWSANPAAFQGIRIDGYTSGLGVAIFAVDNGILYAWDPVNGASGGFRSDNFSNGAGNFSVDISGNLKASTIKFGGSAGVAISESPANVIQATLADLSTSIPVRMRGAALLGATPSSSSDTGTQGEIRVDGSFIYRYDSGAWARAALVFSSF